MTLRQKYTPPQYAKRRGISPDKVVAWIKSGELPAMDSSTNRDSARPRYLIDEADIEAFELSRMVVPPTPKTRRRRRRREASEIEFF